VCNALNTIHLHLKIQEIETLDSIPDYWSLQDYQALLQRCDIEGGEQMTMAEAEDMLYMALTDKEPDEAAKIVLEYKFSDWLRAGQIDQMSHEMLEDCLPEEHADISLHYDLFAINELLNRAFKNKFPEAKATRIRFHLKVDGAPLKLPSKESLLKAFALCFTDGQIITRLYKEQLAGEVAFPEADSILWQIQSHGDQVYSILTSRYWLEREDFSTLSADGEIRLK